LRSSRKPLFEQSKTARQLHGGLWRSQKILHKTSEIGNIGLDARRFGLGTSKVASGHLGKVSRKGKGTHPARHTRGWMHDDVTHSARHTRGWMDDDVTHSARQILICDQDRQGRGHSADNPRQV
jgi:hypothetical protein